jgi:hypothetical protein
VTTKDPLAVVRDGGDGATSLRATFLARMRRGDSTERARGVLLVRKPDRFRLRLSSLFGLTILDYVSNAGDDRLWLASEERVLAGDEIARSASFSPAAVRLIFLRKLGVWQRDCREGVEPDEAVVECMDERGRVHYRGYVERTSGLLRREIVLDEEQPRLTVAYGDYRPASGLRLPYAIEWSEISSGARVEIEIDRYEVDPPLRDELFAPAQRRDREER